MAPPGATWQAYLRFHAIDGASPYLNRSRTTVRVLRQDAQRPAGTGAALEARAGHRQQRHGHGLGQLYVKEFPPEAKARAQTLVDNVRAALKARIESSTG
jgi:putative endopeptidase